MTKMYKLAHERLLEVLDFDPATGLFVWKVARSNRVKVGSRAGVIHRASGGRYISIDNEKLMAHRLAFYYVNGRWPNTDVRPLDGNYDHCAISNLREVSRVELAHERNAVKTNTSGYAGVSRAKRGKWQASITWNYRQISLGASFDTPEDAAYIHDEAERRLKQARNEADVTKVVEEVRLFKRQRAIWLNLWRQKIPMGWDSFEQFSAEVTSVPEYRYALVPVDATKMIGPGNFKWSLPIDTEISTREGAVAYKRANREANRDYYRDRDFRKKYGIDFAQYQNMLVAQKGVCAICEKPETKFQHGAIRMLSVDHDHNTGAVRSLLCANCNMALGYFCDDQELLRKAIGYLQKHSGESNVRPFTPAVINGALGTGA